MKAKVPFVLTLISTGAICGWLVVEEDPEWAYTRCGKEVAIATALSGDQHVARVAWCGLGKERTYLKSEGVLRDWGRFTGNYPEFADVVYSDGTVVHDPARARRYLPRGVPDDVWRVVLAE